MDGSEVKIIIPPFAGDPLKSSLSTLWGPKSALWKQRVNTQHFKGHGARAKPQSLSV